MGASGIKIRWRGFTVRPSCRAGRWLLMVALFTVLHCVTFQAYADSVEIIVNQDHAGAALDRDQLRAAFTMRMREWPDGRPLKVFVLQDSNDVHDQFCRELLGTYPYVLRNVWDRMVFTGTGLAPITVQSEEEMRVRVKNTPGAIGYVHINHSSSTDSPHHNLARFDQVVNHE